MIWNELECSHAKLSLAYSQNSQRRKFHSHSPQIVENSAPNIKVLLTVSVTHIYCGFLSVSCARMIKKYEQNFFIFHNQHRHPFPSHTTDGLLRHFSLQKTFLQIFSCSIDLLRLQYRITYKVSFVELNFKCSRECATSDSHRRREKTFVIF